jgi:hypothetical protein
LGWEASPYLKERKKRYTLTKNYADKNGRVTDYTLVLYFGKMKLDTITPEVVDKSPCLVERRAPYCAKIKSK